MRTVLAALLSLGVLTSVATPALAQGPSSKSQEVKTVSGTVKSAAKDGFVVTSKDGDKDREYAFSIDDRTMVRKGNQPGTLSDLQPGDRVTVNFAPRDGKTFAQTVTVAQP
jgi:Cu/Ag efflux protein CusF